MASISWYLRAVGMVAVTLATATGNMAVLTALCRVSRAPAHYPLASLAAADLMLGVIVLPLTIATDLYAFNLHRLICTFWNILDVLCCTVSILSICLLGWERWSGITNPFARAHRARRARLYAALVWLMAAAVAIPTAFVPFHEHYLEGEMAIACAANTNVGYVFVSTFLSFYLPAGVMLAMYVGIVRALAEPWEVPMRVHHGRRPTLKGRCNLEIETKNEDAPSTLIDKREKQIAAYLRPRQRRATRAIVLLMALFLICWTPFFIILPLGDYVISLRTADSLCECVPIVVREVCTWLSFLNSALNPLVYAAASPSVRRALRGFFSGTSENVVLSMDTYGRPDAR